MAGRPSYAESGEVAAAALRTLADALPKAKFLPALRRGNVFGALDMGLAPGAPARPGQPRRRPGALHRRLGLGPGEHRAPHGRHPRPRWPASASAGAPRHPVRALVLLGADPLSDFPDHALAKAALSAGHFVVAVTGHPSQSVDAYADVVLPCAVAHERPGTTTNLEGRVSRLGPKLTAPGFAWPDWMIAAELADALGADLGVASLTDLADEVALTAPAYAGLTQDVLHSDAAHDGIVVPIVDDDGRHADVEPIDPVALPGVESVERQGAPPRVGTGGTGARCGAPVALGSPPPLLSGTGTGGPEPARPQGRQLHAAPRGRPPPLRRRQLGDRVALAHAAGAHAGGAGQPLRPRPAGQDDGGPGQGALGPGRADPGGRGGRGRAPRRGRHRLQRPGGESAPGNAAATLIDSRQLVTDVRLESV